MLQQAEAKRLTIEDDFGVEHVYMLFPMKGSRAWHAQRKITKAAAPAIVAVKGAVSTMFDEAEGMSDGEVAAEMAPAFAMIVSHILDAADESFVLWLLESTMRDNTQFTELSNATTAGRLAFEQAYMRNTGELYEVLVAIIRYNFEPALRRLYKNGGKLRALAEAALQKKRESEESEASSQMQT